MRFGVFVFACFLIPSVSFANEQYSKQYCEQLESERAYIRKRMNAGYTDRQRNYLNDKYRELFHLIGNHCRSPYSDSNTSTSSFQNERKRHQQSIYYSSSAINNNWSARNKTYQGNKSKAWDDFYSVPSRCRQRNLSNDDFVFCSENKIEQKKQFESYWHSLDGR